MKRFRGLATLGMVLYTSFGFSHLVFYVYLVLSGVLDAPVFVRMEHTTISMFGEELDYLGFYKGLNIMTGVYMASVGLLGLFAMPWMSSTPTTAKRTAVLYIVLASVTLGVLIAYSHLPAVAIFVLVIAIFVGAFFSVPRPGVAARTRGSVPLIEGG